jgi:hypothetical protein
MPLSHQDQLQVLHDILTNHLSDCCGTVSECEQMERLIKSLLGNDELDSQTKQLLEEVYYYSQQGKYTPDLDSHINTNQDNITNWVNQFPTLS